MTIDIKTILSQLPINHMDSDKFDNFLENMENAYDLFVTDFIFSTTNDVYEVFTGAFLKRFAQYFEPILSMTNEKKMMNAFFIYKFFEELDGRASHGYRVLAPVTLEELRKHDTYGERSLPKKFNIAIKDKDSSLFTALMFILASVNRDFNITLLEFKKANSDGNGFTQSAGMYGESVNASLRFENSRRSLGFLKFQSFVMSSGWLTDIDLALVAYMKSHVLKDHIDVLYTDNSYARNGLGRRLYGLNNLRLNVKQLNSDDNIPAYFSHVFPVGNYMSRPNISLIAILFSNASSILQSKLMKPNCDKELKELVHLNIIKVYQRFNDVLNNPKEYYRYISVLFNVEHPIGFGGYRTIPENKSTKYFSYPDIFYINEVDISTKHRDITILAVPDTVFGNLPTEYMKKCLLDSADQNIVSTEFGEVFRAIMGTFHTLLEYVSKDSSALAEYSTIVFSEIYSASSYGGKEPAKNDDAFLEMQSTYRVVPPFIFKLANHPLFRHRRTVYSGSLTKNICDKLEGETFLPSIVEGEIFEFFNRILDIERESLHNMLKNGLYKNSRRTDILFYRYDTSITEGMLYHFSEAVRLYLSYQAMNLEDPSTNKIKFEILDDLNQLIRSYSGSTNNLIAWYARFQYAVEDDYELYADVIDSFTEQFFKIVENCEIVNHIKAIFAHINSSLNLERCLDTYSTIITPGSFNSLYAEIRGLVNTDVDHTVNELNRAAYNTDCSITKELITTTRDNFVAQKLDALEGKEVAIRKFLNNVVSFIEHINNHGYNQIMKSEVLPILKEKFLPETVASVVNDPIKFDAILLEPALYANYAKKAILRNQIESNNVKNPMDEYYEYYMGQRDYLLDALKECQVRIPTIAKIFKG